MKMNAAPKRLVFAGLAGLVLGAGAFTAYALMIPPPGLLGAWNMTDHGVAISGYDTVAYFTEGKPQKGSAEFQHSWQDATWQFAKQSHRDLFAADPEAYAPAYGGYCAYGVALRNKPSIDPEAWSIVDGRLYLNLSKSIQARWEQDIPGYIVKADAIWLEIVDD